ncbi:MAG: hypothetical protein ACP5L4_01890 [Thermoplasmata archaeon]
MTKTKILLDYDEDSFYVCIMCGANVEHPREVEFLIYEKLPEEAWVR